MYMYDLFMKKQKAIHTLYLWSYLLWKCQDSETGSDVGPQVDSEDEKSLEMVFNCKVTFQLMSQFCLPFTLVSYHSTVKLNNIKETK